MDSKSDHVSAAVLEFHVYDLKEAIAYYGDQVAGTVMQGLGRTAHVHVDDSKIILKEIRAETTRAISTG